MVLVKAANSTADPPKLNEFLVHTISGLYHSRFPPSPATLKGQYIKSKSLNPGRLHPARIHFSNSVDVLPFHLPRECIKASGKARGRRLSNPGRSLLPALSSRCGSTFSPSSHHHYDILTSIFVEPSLCPTHKPTFLTSCRRTVAQLCNSLWHTIRP